MSLTLGPEIKKRFSLWPAKRECQAELYRNAAGKVTKCKAKGFVRINPKEEVCKGHFLAVKKLVEAELNGQPQF